MQWLRTALPRTAGGAAELGVNAATSPHLLIEGDNLDVLKLLERDHSDLVDLIYIDPPYNTGNASSTTTIFASR